MTVEVVARAPDVPELQMLRTISGLSLRVRIGRRTGRSMMRRHPPWALGSGVTGERCGTILFAPRLSEVSQLVRELPGRPILVAESFDRALQSWAASDNVVPMPRSVPDLFFAPGPGADAFGVTRRLHLETRPRLVYLGGFQNGRAVTQLFELTRRLLTQGGEVVLFEGLAYRQRLAPVVKSLRLSETIIFAPPLGEAEVAGLFLGADVMIVDDATPALAIPLSWALASGTPIVARHGAGLQAVLGPAALWVYEESIDMFERAVLAALQKSAVREELSHRQLIAAEPWRTAKAAPQWLEALAAYQ